MGGTNPTAPVIGVEMGPGSMDRPPERLPLVWHSDLEPVRCGVMVPCSSTGS